MKCSVSGGLTYDQGGAEGVATRRLTGGCSIRLPARRPVAQDMIDVDRHSASAYARPSEGRRRSRLAVHETGSAEPAKPRLLDRVQIGRASCRERVTSAGWADEGER